MKRSLNLAHCLADYERHGNPVEIHLVWKDYTKAGIGNPQAIAVAMDALTKELKRQYDDAVANGN